MLLKTDGIYHETSAEQAEPICSLISGRNLAHARRTALDRAFVAAELHLNRVELVSPTVKQCAHLAGVCVPYVAAAVVIADDEAARQAVLAGRVSLLDAAKDNPESLAEHFARTSPAEWLECARTVGPSVIWDSMISPLI